MGERERADGWTDLERDEGEAACACVIIIWGTAAAVLIYGGGIAWPQATETKGVRVIKVGAAYSNCKQKERDSSRPLSRENHINRTVDTG